MPENEGQTSDKKPETTEFLEFNHMQRLAIVSGVTVGTIIAAGAIGYYLDTVFGTKPWLLVVFVLLSFPLTQYLLIRKMKKFADKEYK